MATLNDYKVNSKNVERKLKEEELTSTAVAKDFHRVENELGKVRTEKHLLKIAT